MEVPVRYGIRIQVLVGATALSCGACSHDLHADTPDEGPAAANAPRCGAEVFDEAYGTGAMGAKAALGLVSLTDTARTDAWAVVSEPTYSGGNGRLGAWEVDRSDGSFLTSVIQNIPFSPWSGMFVGSALAVGDIRAGYSISSDVHAGGFELLVGAPGSGSLNESIPGGAILVFRGLKSGDPGSPYNWDRSLTMADVGDLFGEVSTDARFGSSIAIPETDPGDFAPWVAIGGPGIDQVYIFEVDPGVGVGGHGYPTLSWVQTIRNPSPPATGRDAFGATLVAGDFNHDNQPDLAIGAPARNTARGIVYVFAWDGTGFDESGFATIGPGDGGRGSFPLARFGDALAAGRALGSGEHTTLAIGEPGRTVSGTALAGAFCAVDFVVYPAPPAGEIQVESTVCADNPAPTTSARFGAALAIGNFVTTDTFGNSDSYYAQVEEVAVGAPDSPAYSTTSNPDGTISWSVGSAPVGQVVVYRSDLFDGVQAGCGTWECAPMALLGPTGSGAGQLFGAGLTAGFLQENDLEDLIIGSPGTGKGYLTKDLPQVGFTDAFNGV